MMKISTLIKKYLPFILLFCVLPTVVLADEKLCPNYIQFKEEIAQFWPRFCFEIMRDVFCDLAEMCWDKFAKPLQGVIAVGAGLYIAVYTLKTLGSFSQQDIAAYFSNNKTGLLLLMAKIAFAFVLLSDEEFVYKYLVKPIIEAGATIGSNDWGKKFEDVSNVRTLFDKVIDQIAQFNGKAHEIIAMGRLMLCLTTLPDTIIDWHWKMVPFGGIIYIFGGMIILFLAFYMMDIIFRLGVGCVLLPFAIACGVSKLTSHYTKQVWNLFINVAFNFILLKIIIDFSIEMIKKSLNFLISAKIQAILEGGKRYLNDADAEEFLRSLSLEAFVLVSLACVIAIKLFFDVETIAEKISNAASVGKLGQKVGADLAKPVAKTGETAIKESARFGGAMVVEGGNSVSNSRLGRAVRNRYRRSAAWIRHNIFRLP